MMEAFPKPTWVTTCTRSRASSREEKALPQRHRGHGMKLEDLSLRQIAIGVPILGLINWAGLQYAILPNMPEERRRELYAGSASSPYFYGVSCAFILFAVWFVFRYQGRFSTHGRR